MKKSKRPQWKWLSEFKNFICKGDILQLSIGVMVGASFNNIVKNFSDNIITPIISMVLGKGADFSELKIALPRLFGEPVFDENGVEIVNTLNYGNFISAVINFLILALVVFWLVKVLNKLTEIGKKKEEEAVAETQAELPPPEPSAEEKLLTEIRDLLKANNDKN